MPLRRFFFVETASNLDFVRNALVLVVVRGRGCIRLASASRDLVWSTPTSPVFKSEPQCGCYLIK